MDIDIDKWMQELFAIGAEYDIVVAGMFDDIDRHEKRINALIDKTKRQATNLEMAHAGIEGMASYIKKSFIAERKYVTLIKTLTDEIKGSDREIARLKAPSNN